MATKQGKSAAKTGASKAGKAAAKSGGQTAKAAATPTRTAGSGALPLFYSNPVPIDFTRHAGKSLSSDLGYRFAAETNSIPLNVAEFPYALHDYLIGFTNTNPVTAIAVVGLRNRENLFVGADGQWDPNVYIPAYVRRYPFVFLENRQSGQLTLCVDERPETVVEGDQRPLVSDGKASPLVDRALEFCKEYHAIGKQTEEFIGLLTEHDLLVERTAQMNKGDGSTISLSGMKVVSEARLNALDAGAFAALREKGFLLAIYAHLLSLNRLTLLGRRINSRDGQETVIVSDQQKA